MREDKKILVVRKYIKNSIVFFLIILSFLFNCCNLGNKKHSKNNHIATFKIGDNLYNEKFQIYFGGVYAGDSYIEYITDSINFRKYIGTYNDDEWMIYKKNNQFIDVYKRNIKVVHSKQAPGFYKVYDTSKIASYDINELIQEKKFD